MNMRKNPDMQLQGYNKTEANLNMQMCAFYGAHTIRERETFKVPAFRRPKKKEKKSN